MLCSKILKNKSSRQWQYYIWLIVVARLLRPFAPETNLIKNISQTFNYVYPVDLDALSENTNNINNQKADTQVNYDNNNIPVSIQSTDSLIS